MTRAGVPGGPARTRGGVPLRGPHAISDVEQHYHLSDGVITYRKGGDQIVLNNQTAEQHEAAMRGLRAFRDEAPQLIAERAAKLRQLCTEYDGFEVIAQFAFAEQAVDPNNYRESEHEGSVAYVEFLMCQLLSQPYQQGPKDWITPEAMAAIRGAVSEVFRLAMHYNRSLGVTDDFKWSSDPMDQMRLESVMQWLHVRNPAFAPHIEEWLRELFAHPTLARWMSNDLGFTIEEALRINRAMEDLPNEAVVQRLLSAREWRKEAEQIIRNARQGPPLEGKEGLEADLAALLAKPQSEQRAILDSELVARSFLGLALTLSFAPSAIAQKAGCSEKAALAYLSARSLTFGDLPPGDDIPSPTLEVHRKPFLRHQDRFMAPLAIWHEAGLQAFLEKSLRETAPALLEKYWDVRGDLLERQAFQTIRAAMPLAQSWRSLQYTIVEEGKPKRAELDALFILDRAVILVETKAATMTAPARRGGVSSLKRKLKDILGEGHRQGLRARRYIEESSAPEFHDDSGVVVKLDKSRMGHLLVVTVSFESLTVFTVTLREAAAAGVLEDGPPPWAVSLFDLRVICDLIEFPSQFVHYILRRMTIPDLERFSAIDELDWFACYLNNRLRFKPVDPTLGFMLLESQTDAIEQFYYYRSGIRTKPAARPQLRLPATLRAMLSEVECLRPPNYLPGALMLLDMTQKDCRQLADTIKDDLRGVRRHGRVAIREFTRNEGIREGLTLAVSTGTAEELERWLDAHCRQKVDKEDSEHWIGLGMLTASGTRLRVFQVAIK